MRVINPGQGKKRKTKMGKQANSTGYPEERHRKIEKKPRKTPTLHPPSRRSEAKHSAPGHERNQTLWKNGGGKYERSERPGGGSPLLGGNCQKRVQSGWDRKSFIFIHNEIKAERTFYQGGGNMFVVQGPAVPLPKK